MTKTKIFDGRELAESVKQELVGRVKKLEGVKGRQLRLVTVLDRKNEAGWLYVAKKQELAGQLGIAVQVHEIGEGIDPNRLIEKMAEWNRDERVDGVMVQMPLPSEWHEASQQVVNSIYAEKDVDCLTAVNLGLVTQGQVRVLPATVEAIVGILAQMGYEAEKMQGVPVCVVGASGMVGRPLAMSLQNYGASVAMCDEFTRDLSQYTKQAEVLISTTGVAGLVTGELVKQGAVVIDVGIAKQADGSLTGDVEMESVMQVASQVTPVPGGVGPVTVVSLLQNLVSLVELGSSNIS